MPTAVIPETDVIDLERYLKLPHWMSAAEKVKYTSRLTNSHTNSSTGTIRRYGEVIAYTHEVPKTGYKATNAYGSRSIFEGKTTTGDFQSRVRKVGDENSKSLMPYHPNASRNRPEKTLQNTVGKRFVSWRNQSQVVIKDGDPDSVRPPRTTNQVYDAGLTEVIGLSNQGISAEIAKTLHAKQRR